MTEGAQWPATPRDPAEPSDPYQPPPSDTGPPYPPSGPQYPPAGQPYPPAYQPPPGAAYPPQQPFPQSGPPAYPVSGGGAPYPVSGGALVPADGPVIAQIGELAVTSSTVHTPAGPIPLRGSNWQVSDQWMTVQKIPTWAVVMAIVGFCILTVFSLLFLLVKENAYQGVVQIIVSNGPQQYVSRIPVASQAQVHHIHQQVNYVRSLAAL